MKRILLFCLLLVRIGLAQYSTMGPPPPYMVAINKVDPMAISDDKEAHILDGSGVPVLSMFNPICDSAINPLMCNALFNLEQYGSGFTVIEVFDSCPFKVLNSGLIPVDSFCPALANEHEFHCWADSCVFIVADWDGSPWQHSRVVIQKAGSTVWEFSTVDYYLTNPRFSPDSADIVSGDPFNVYHFNSVRVAWWLGIKWVVISARHQGVYLISWNKTAILKIGGNGSDFAVSSPFRGQHSARLKNGVLWLYDNGIDHPARGVSYSLDYLNKTATLSWAFEHPAGVPCMGAGSIYSDSAGVLIGWGTSSPLIASFVHPDGSEWHLQGAGISYRVNPVKPILTGIRNRVKSIRRREEWWNHYNLLGQEK